MTSQMPDITGHHHMSLMSSYVVTMAPTLPLSVPGSAQELPASETQIPVSSPAQSASLSLVTSAPGASEPEPEPPLCPPRAPHCGLGLH